MNLKKLNGLIKFEFLGDFGPGWKIQGNEPLFIDDVTIDRGLGTYINARNIKAYRVSNFNIEKIRVNMDNFNLDIIVDFKNVNTIFKENSNIF